MLHIEISSDIFHAENGLQCTVSEGNAFTCIVAYQGDLRDVPSGVYRDGTVSFQGKRLTKAQKYVLIDTYIACRLRLEGDLEHAKVFEEKVDALVKKDETLWDIESEIQRICLGL